MHVIAGKPDGLPEGMLARVSRYRHKVFVEKLGWKLRVRDGEEQDQFDRPDTVYVVSSDAQGDVNGCARLLPTHKPYLLGEVFPQLLDGAVPPSSPEIWEISRFAAVDFKHPGIAAAGQFSSPVTVRLLQESIACAASLGARRLITVSPLGIERLLHRILNKSGYYAHRAGTPVMIAGQPVFACWIELGGQSAGE